VIPSNYNLCLKFLFILVYQFFGIGRGGWHRSCMEVALVSFHFCLMGSKVSIFSLFLLSFCLYSTCRLVWSMFPIFLWFRSIFVFPAHFIFFLITFLLDYSCLWLTSWVSFVVICRFGLVWCIYKGQPCNSFVPVPFQICSKWARKS